MIYGLDNFISNPPLGAITSLLIIFGLDALGIWILRLLKINLRTRTNSWLRFQAPLIATALLICLIFPIVLTGFFTLYVSRSIGFILLFIGLLHFLGKTLGLIFKEKLSVKKIKELQLLDWALIWILFGYMLIALGPVTDADSLDYHIGTAIYILNTGGFPFQPEWFHSRLIGGGEILIALGLSVGSEQFSSLLQLLGLACILSIFLTKPGTVTRERKWIALAAASTPVLMALVPAAKPLLLPCAMTTSALVIINFYLTDEQVRKGTKKIGKYYFLVCMLAMTAATIKANFMLSGAIVVGVAFFILQKNRNWILGLGYSISMFLITLFPFLLWKYTYFNGHGVLNFLAVFPGSWPGYDNFKDALVNYRGNEVVFPFSLIFPAGFGFVTVILGLGVFYIASFLNAFNFKCNNIVFASLILILESKLTGSLPV